MSHNDMQAVIDAWLYETSRKRGSKRTDGNCIYYYDKAIATKNKNGTFQINTAGYSKSRSTRDFINIILYSVYGAGAPKLVSRDNVIYIFYPEADESNKYDEWNDDKWFEFTDKDKYKVVL